MKILPALLVVVLASAANWSNYGGDPQHSGWQRHEKLLSVTSVKGMKLLWKRQLDNQSKGQNSLTAPVMLGPIITHRGIKELVFIAGASDNLYAVDADLGKLFWKRHFDNAAQPCGAGLTATPAIAPDPDADKDDPDEEDDFTSLLPIYTLSSDGNLHTVRPSDGTETTPPVKLVPANANASSLNFTGKSIYTTTSGSCGGAADGTWSIDVETPGAKAKFSRVTDGLAIGRATWVDKAGTRWIYSAGARGVTAFKVSFESTPVWTSRPLGALSPPVIANGVLFVLASGDKSTHATLYAFDAVTGKELYSSGSAITSFVDSSALAVANGHVCFGTSDNTLYCFGLPIEI